MVERDFEKDKKRLAQLIKEKALLKGDFTLSSGKKSSYYLDYKMVSLNPEGAFLTAKLTLEALKETDFEAIGGMSLGADPIVGAIATLSFEKGRPLKTFIVRKEPKEYGSKKWLEGPIDKGMKVVILEDVATTGASILKAISRVEEVGGKVVKVLAVVDRQEGARQRIEKSGYPFLSLFTPKDLGF